MWVFANKRDNKKGRDLPQKKKKTRREGRVGIHEVMLVQIQL